MAVESIGDGGAFTLGVWPPLSWTAFSLRGSEHHAGMENVRLFSRVWDPAIEAKYVRRLKVVVTESLEKGCW